MELKVNVNCVSKASGSLENPNLKSCRINGEYLELLFDAVPVGQRGLLVNSACAV